jgi:ketosteroid isomerase-like protein
MKNTLRTILIMSALVAGTPLSGRPSGPAADIRSLLEAQAAAWNRGDVPAFMEGYWKSSKTEFVSSSGVHRGWQAVLDRYRKAYPDRQTMGKLTFSELEITMLCSDAALILGHWELQRAHDHPAGIFTLVMRRLPEGWRIVRDHTSTVGGH